MMRTYTYESDTPKVSAKAVASWLNIVAKRFGPISGVSYYEDETGFVIEAEVGDLDE